MNKTNTRTLVLASLFLALALVLPFVTGQIPEVGGFAELRYNKNGFLTEATFTRY